MYCIYILRRFPLLYGSGAGIPGIGKLVLQYWDIEWRWHLLMKLRC